MVALQENWGDSSSWGGHGSLYKISWQSIKQSNRDFPVSRHCHPQSRAWVKREHWKLSVKKYIRHDNRVTGYCLLVNICAGLRFLGQLPPCSWHFCSWHQLLPSACRPANLMSCLCSYCSELTKPARFLCYFLSIAIGSGCQFRPCTFS